MLTVGRNPSLFISSSGGNNSENLPALVLEPFIGKKKFAYTSFLFSSSADLKPWEHFFSSCSTLGKKEQQRERTALHD